MKLLRITVARISRHDIEVHDDFDEQDYAQLCELWDRGELPVPSQPYESTLDMDFSAEVLAEYDVDDDAAFPRRPRPPTPKRLTVPETIARVRAIRAALDDHEGKKAQQQTENDRASAAQQLAFSETLQ